MYQTMLNSYCKELIREQENATNNTNHLVSLEVKNNDEYAFQYLQRRSFFVSQFEAIEHLSHLCWMFSNHTQTSDVVSENIMKCDRYGHRLSELRRNRWYTIFYHSFSDLIFVEVIPWIAIIVMNISVWRASKRFQERRRRLLDRNDTAAGTSKT